MSTPTPDTPPPSDLTPTAAPQSTPPPSGIAFTALSEHPGNFPMALLAGFGAALIGAAIWALITVATEYQLGLMAVGIGFLVGYAIRWAGKGGSAQKFAVAGAVLALFGCLLGNLLTIAAVIGKMQGIEFFRVLGRLLAQPGMTFDLMVDAADIMDAVFYAIAIYEGYKLSRPQLRA